MCTKKFIAVWDIIWCLIIIVHDNKTKHTHFPKLPQTFFLLTYPIHHLSLSFALNSITDLISVWPIIQVKSFAFSPKFWILKYTFLYPQVNFNYLLLIGFQFQSFEIFFFFFWAFKNHVKVQNFVAYLESENVYLVGKLKKVKSFTI